MNFSYGGAMVAILFSQRDGPKNRMTGDVVASNERNIFASYSRLYTPTKSTPVYRVLNVVSASSPTKIAQAIIAWVAIVVATFMPWRTWADEGQKNQTMNKLSSSFTVPVPHGYAQMPKGVLGGGAYPPVVAKQSVSARTFACPNTSIVTNGIPGVVGNVSESDIRLLGKIGDRILELHSGPPVKVRDVESASVSSTASDSLHFNAFQTQKKGHGDPSPSAIMRPASVIMPASIYYLPLAGPGYVPPYCPT